MVNPDMGNFLEGKIPDVGSSAAVGEVEKAPPTEEGSSERTEGSQNPLTVKNISSENHEYLASRLSWKRKVGSEAGSKVVVPEPQNICLRLRSASGQKSLLASRAASEVPPTNTKGSLSKDLKTLRPSSSLISEPLLGSSKAPILIPAAPTSSRAKGKAPEVNVAPTYPAVEASPAQGNGTSKFKLPEGFQPHSPLAPLFAEGLPVPYVRKWRITP
ncbi:hypothetical protein HanOQP8_Chr03g0100821 [Helianthus annuus]|nr:hypothetical protein HanOQP8_Chr03g0100821 [Helianthus annuus]